MKRRAIFLDVGWTLIHPVRSLWELAAEAAAAAGKQMSAASCEASVHPLWQAAQAQAVSTFHAEAEYPDSDALFAGLFRQFAEVAFATAGLDGPSDALVERFLSSINTRDAWRVFPEVPAVLERLRGDGYLLAVVSNAASDLPAFLAELGLARFFDVILASAAEGTKKPDRRLFQRALELTSVAPAEAFHIGDLALEDVLGARNVGVPAALIHRGPLSLFPSFAPVLPAEARSTPVVGDLVEALSILR